MSAVGIDKFAVPSTVEELLELARAEFGTDVQFIVASCPCGHDDGPVMAGLRSADYREGGLGLGARGFETIEAQGWSIARHGKDPVEALQRAYGSALDRSK